MRYAPIVLFICISVIGAQASQPDTKAPDTDDILNQDFGDHLGYITTRNHNNETGIYIYSDEIADYVLTIAQDELQDQLAEYLPGRLIASDKVGVNALFDLGSGRYQMRLTTPNGQIDFTYRGNTPGSVQPAEMTTLLEEDIVLTQSEDKRYAVLLLTTGEVAIRMGPDNQDTIFEVILTNTDDHNIEFRTLPADPLPADS